MRNTAAKPSEMAETPARYAAIDVGTNSTKMLVAELGEKPAAIFTLSAVTRLGEGMTANTMFLREGPIRRTLDALAEMADAARQQNAAAMAAVGTAALRDAENRDDFLRRALEKTGVTVEVIPGEEEARLSYLAVRRDPLWRSETTLRVIDIGGGSTEIIQGIPSSEQIASRISVNLGAVKLTEACLRSDPVSVTQMGAANAAAQEQFAQVAVSPDADALLVGVGGTLTNLAAMQLGRIAEPDELNGLRLSSETLSILVNRLADATIEERKTFPGLDPRRADIILAGAILLSQALSHLGASEIAVSTRGLRWGVLFDRFAE